MHSKSYKRNLTILESWRDGMMQLGEAIASFQFLEEKISDCIAALIGRDRKIGRIISSELSFRAKVSVFVVLFLHRTTLSKLPDDMRNFVGKLYEAEQRRNTIVHSCWDANFQKPSTIKRRKRVCRRDGFKEIREHVEPLELEENTKAFENLAEDLLFQMNKYAFKYVTRLPKA
jgi:hypothetical protein